MDSSAYSDEIAQALHLFPFYPLPPRAAKAPTAVFNFLQYTSFPSPLSIRRRNLRPPPWPRKRRAALPQFSFAKSETFGPMSGILCLYPERRVEYAVRPDPSVPVPRRGLPLAGEQKELCARRDPQGAGLPVLRDLGVLPVQGIPCRKAHHRGPAAGLHRGLAAESALRVREKGTAHLPGGDRGLPQRTHPVSRCRPAGSEALVDRPDRGRPADGPADVVDLPADHRQEGVQDLRRGVHRRHRAAELRGRGESDRVPLRLYRDLRRRFPALPRQRYRAHPEHLRQGDEAGPAGDQHRALLRRADPDRFEPAVFELNDAIRKRSPGQRRGIGCFWGTDQYFFASFTCLRWSS